MRVFKTRGRPGVTVSKEAARCPSGPGVFVLSACTGRHPKARMKRNEPELIAFINKGDASGGSTKMASKPQKNNAALFRCQVKGIQPVLTPGWFMTVNLWRQHVVKQV